MTQSSMAADVFDHPQNSGTGEQRQSSRENQALLIMALEQQQLGNFGTPNGWCT